VRRRRGPRPDQPETAADGGNDGAMDIASPAAAEPTLWAASDHDGPLAAPSVAEPTLIETSPEPAPVPVYVVP
jgi:hypothetical protein